ncbi:16S rRNA (guanine(966)-N(2))-methyltransferase RsmD [Paenibacillus sp. N1-5-1-14]|uniref:16S rRNA (guanine(966)-N(2))-methyltransferase RsmD n=1 Tax=Paenibacillus radicibacter TaxID=2972488 RepID=UPI00215959E3|nr:16S rRNA (guanine(966)-N(2))-methyltransferase RsmD [Paenibacillus radicibacter]MCR8641797.1 16S rRNA (guanine(966)-N(2))-methyltransferase RsmD [Paenibacillus radicibacter]
MRVISGKARGRSLQAVSGMKTRPTTDKVKEAIFSMIGPYFDGGMVLDLFAGTGGLGIEALSRGVDKAIFIDMDKKSIDTVVHNLDVTKLRDQAEVYRNDANRAIKLLAKRGVKFDYVFLDPPYRLKIIEELLTLLEEGELFAEDAVIVVETDSADELPKTIGGCVWERRTEYGEIAVSIYNYNHIDSSHKE